MNIAYVRVSTKKQALTGESMPHQIERLNNYAKFKGIKIDEMLVDEGISSYSERHTIEKIRDLAKNRQLDNLLVYSFSRLGRRFSHTIELVEYLQENKCVLHSIKENLDLSTAMGKAMFRAMINFYQLETDMLRERVKEVLYYKQSKNERTGGIPFGFHTRKQINAKGKIVEILVKNKTEQETLKMIKDLRFVEKLSYRKIINRLHERKRKNNRGIVNWNLRSVERYAKSVTRESVV